MIKLNNFFIKDVILVKHSLFSKKAGAKIQQYFNYKKSMLVHTLTS
jgi:hypothetical protein